MERQTGISQKPFSDIKILDACFEITVEKDLSLRLPRKTKYLLFVWNRKVRGHATESIKHVWFSFQFEFYIFS